MATVKQLVFIEAICRELNLDEPSKNISIRVASKFISKNVAKFYAKKAREKESGLQVNNRDNYKYKSAFRSIEKTNRISSEQNVENIKNILRQYFGFDIWTHEKR